MRAPSDLERLLPAETRSEKETLALGRALATRLERGDVVALYGNLGAGKTVLVRGICLGLGIQPSRITSPTFTIVHEYEDAPMPVYHFDAYRIRRIGEFYEIGYDEYFFGGGVSLVEWADKVESLLPDHALRIRVEHAGGDVRRVSRIETVPTPPDS